MVAISLGRRGKARAATIRDHSRSVTAPAHRIADSLRARLGPGGGRAGLVAAVAAGTFLLDQATKLAAVELLAGEERTEVLGGLVDIELYRNFAGPNNILPGHTELLSIVSLVAVAVLVVVAFKVRSTLSAIGVGLLLGGAAGNLADRLLREPEPLKGGVIDWFSLLDLTKMMNIADVAIHLAVLLIVIAAVFGARDGEDAAAGDPPERRPAG